MRQKYVKLDILKANVFYHFFLNIQYPNVYLDNEKTTLIAKHAVIVL